MTQSPRYRQCTPALWRGPGGMPLALRLSEGLGCAAKGRREADAANDEPGAPAPRASGADATWWSATQRSQARAHAGLPQAVESCKDSRE